MPCSTTCGNGSMFRKRQCFSPSSSGGLMCVGDNMEYLNACNLGIVQLTGNGALGHLHHALSLVGMVLNKRIRSCDNPKPSDDGQDCVWPSMESVTCNLGQCRVDGECGSWMTTPCSTSCETVLYIGKRICDSQAPSKGRLMCVGDNMEYLKACNLRNCQLTGNGAHGRLRHTLSHVVGIKHRIRSCDNPKPSDDGKDCVGPSIESVICNL
ncbi:HMCN [Mytilus edulis]|uniref:HMCN n=1 Tax=Mytilus edulis TaxID=6550 RepID=A0A8S3SRN3_MYTED|nr:HMCN [Mytilus edulis]